MKNFILGLVLGFLMGSIVSSASADPTDRSVEYIVNRIWDSSNNTLRITAQ